MRALSIVAHEWFLIYPEHVHFVIPFAPSPGGLSGKKKNTHTHTHTRKTVEALARDFASYLFSPSAFLPSLPVSLRFQQPFFFTSWGFFFFFLLLFLCCCFFFVFFFSGSWLRTASNWILTSCQPHRVISGRSRLRVTFEQI